jgi:hypothetical protein
MSDIHAAWLAASMWSSRLRRLDLSWNLIQREGAQSLCESSHLAELEQLNLRRNPLASDRLAVEAVRRRFGPRVRW